MTKEEIIHRLQYARRRIDNVTYAPDVLKAIDIAIEAVGNTDADTISRQAAIAEVEKSRAYVGHRYNIESMVGRDIFEMLDNVVLGISKLPPAQPEQLEQCPIYGGMCAYPSDQCYDCPRHAGAKMGVTS